MREDQKNLLLAMALSLVVILGWNYFYAKPQLDATRQTNTQVQNNSGAAQPPSAQPAPQQQQGAAPVPGASTAPNAPQAPAVAVTLDRNAALAASPRVKIDTPSLSGSIALRGARIDDIHLKKYHETTDPKSPTIELLSPSGSAHPYYAETGFVAAANSNVALPKPDTLWTADSDVLTSSKPLTLTYDNGQGLVFRRVLSVDDNFMFTIKDSVENKSAAPVTVYPYGLLTRVGKPKTDGYAVLHEGFVGVVGDSRVQEYTYDSIEKEPKATKLLKGTGGWLGMTDKYWAAAVIPDQNLAIEGRFSSTGTTTKIYQSDYLGAEKVVAPGASAEADHRFFAGAKETQVIDGYQASLGIKNFDLMIDWGWFYFITKPLFWLIDFIYRYVGNFGVAILITTVLIKLLFFPLANRSYESMAKMKAVQPQMKELQERFANDKQKQQQELMELYKREKINPVAGCLPVIIQIPVFFALYKVIFITIEMRHAPFFGWIKDLSAPDPTNLFNLFGLIPFDPTQLPGIGHFLWIGIWPLIMGVSMFVQMKMNPEPTDPIQKQMFAWMPVIFTFMLGSFPAGLVIYWTWNNALSVAQQYFIMKKQGVKIELWDNLLGIFGKKAS
ncbi:membrane protein insertase YidC [Methylocella sp. CPCC 101449]|jgi:YidC/Oxa1 family membrane protein insertase|uniref:membrane protein insertase YidC n=1 Tax=Methylocella sp. CPCC 101449 TaxID=2987531 RepID=UPI00289169DC|nr:membrane protein insertase YidC [Methylocella sp. CPCC 101449]MDT2019241.1 membrane protein insertase YidC [Methylocella sp. CPCC 101449]HEV2573360.1 membrane protein insertase YidC [Beijerinckiaceae bacterium]